MERDPVDLVRVPRCAPAPAPLPRCRLPPAAAALLPPPAACGAPTQSSPTLFPPSPARTRREEKYYDREEVLGRDATSVFPTESRRVATAESAALAELLGGGNTRFISETEVGVLGRSCWVELTGSAV